MNDIESLVREIVKLEQEIAYIKQEPEAYEDWAPGSLSFAQQNIDDCKRHIAFHESVVAKYRKQLTEHIELLERFENNLAQKEARLNDLKQQLERRKNT